MLTKLARHEEYPGAILCRIISIGRGRVVGGYGKRVLKEGEGEGKKEAVKGGPRRGQFDRQERGIGPGEHGPCLKGLAGRAELVAYPSRRTAQESPIRRR